VGIPGTGLSYRERLDNSGSGGAGKGGGLGWVVWLVAIVLMGCSLADDRLPSERRLSSASGTVPRVDQSHTGARKSVRCSCHQRQVVLQRSGSQQAVHRRQGASRAAQ